MTNTTRTRKSGAAVKSDTTDAPVITDVPAQSDAPVIEGITDESDKPVVPVISDEVARIVMFATEWKATDKTVDSAPLVTNYRMSVGTEAFASFARAATVEAANRTYGATVAGGMFPRIDDKPGAADETIGKGQVSNLSGSVKMFWACGFALSSVPLVWSRVSTSGGWRDKRNTPECKEMIRRVAEATDESDKVRILLDTPIPDKADKVVDSTAELVKAAETLATLAEAYGAVKSPETRAILDKHLNAARIALAIPATIGVTREG